MARALRTDFPGAVHHVTSRGNERKHIFRDDRDRFHFLELLGDLGERFGAKVHACVLMDNHFHLMAETPEARTTRSNLHTTPRRPGLYLQLSAGKTFLHLSIK